MKEMKFDEIIEKINFLYKKSKEEGLTEEELEEQKGLRRIYIDAFKNNLKSQLNGIEKKEKGTNNQRKE